MSNFNNATFYNAASQIFAEAVLQALSAYYMIATVAYGREHDFYSPTIAKLKMLPSAHHIYTGAIIWLIVCLVTIVLLVQALWPKGSILSSELSTLPDSTGVSKPKRAPLHGARAAIAAFNTYWADLVHAAARHIISKTRDVENTPLLCKQTSYGTLSTEPTQLVLHVVTVKLVLIAVISTGLLTVAQGLFWIGFVGLGMEGYCPPQLGLLTAIWASFSTLGAIVPTVLTRPFPNPFAAPPRPSFR
ncbi:hypothetical protein E8E13_004135 [Curvularia kusanoi]|uniref:Transmembrane protein n=1 Tax=Curvularia kusanoi TaxID=90978 RepID=A0A9P4WB14_CURKU|nr:hypothetical protein E8E13_004135 [Curvularia kusanoi]